MKRTHWLATTTLLLAATTAFPATVTLNGSTGDVTLQNGDVLTGTGGRNTYVTIAAGATVTLSGISIVKNETSTLHPAQIMKPAITCLGDATIVLAKGTVNTIRGGSTMDPCILPGPPNTTLTVKGYGSLVLRTLEMGACIGGSGWLDGTWEGGTLVSTTVHPIDCGNIVIEGGNLDLATGGGWAAAIGSGTDSSCGDITIRGGNIRAVAGYGAAIGTGWRGSCGDITITGGTVYAEQKTYRWSAPIGCSTEGTCGNIFLSGVTSVGVKKSSDDPYPAYIGPSTGACVCATLTLWGKVSDYPQGERFYRTKYFAPTDVPYAVRFDGNGGTGTMAEQGFYSNTPQALRPNAFTRAGQYLSHWSTLADGGGYDYLDEEVVNNVGDVTLYAQWHDCYTVRFNANGGTGAMADQFFASYSQPLTSNAFTRAGYGFDGWNTMPDGSGIGRADGEGGRDLGNATLYAQWHENYTVGFDANGGEGTMESQYFVWDAPTALSSNAFTRADHVFAGWNTMPDGSGASYEDGQSVAKLGNLTLYAQWHPPLRISFRAGDGGSGSMPDQLAVWDAPTALASNMFTHAGYSFIGWGTTSIYIPVYANGQTIRTRADLTLTAVWRANTYAVAYDLGGGANGEGNPTSYTPTYGIFGLADPIRPGWEFEGWTWEGHDTPTTNVVVPRNSWGDITFTAHWGAMTPELGFYEAPDGAVLRGTGGPDTHIVIPDGATVTLRDLDVTSITNKANHMWAGITCLGDATIVLEGTNRVMGGHYSYPGIYVPENKTLTIRGGGTLVAASNVSPAGKAGAGIGGGCDINCGNIVVEGGTIAATGGQYSAGIGSGYKASCGDITVTNGAITATGGTGAAGIGSGRDGACGGIVIEGGDIAAAGGLQAAGIGCGARATCGNIAIAGGSVTAAGGDRAAGIGSGYASSSTTSSCGDITISGGVTGVTAMKTRNSSGIQAIGNGSGGVCGTVAIDPGLVDETFDKTRRLRSGLALQAASDNAAAIARHADGRTHDAQLPGRTLRRDGSWTTLCLPFAVNDLAGTPLEGATVMALASTAFADGRLTMDFAAANGIEAGKPYAVKCREPDLVIRNAAQWDEFAERVGSGAESYAGKLVTLAANYINVSTMVGTEEHPFRGTFDGLGHTLDVHIDAADAAFAAPFRAIGGAVIRNLAVEGDVSGGIHCAGLVGQCADGANLIESCYVLCNVTCGGLYCGGVLGHSGTADATIRNCHFEGSFAGADTAIGILFGWGDAPGVHVVENCLVEDDYRESGIDLLRQHSGTQRVTNCYKTHDVGSLGTCTDKKGVFLAALLGDGWGLDRIYEEGDSGVMPIMASDADVVNPVFRDVTVCTGLTTNGTAWADFIGDTSPVAFAAGDRTALLLGDGGALGFPETNTTATACSAWFRLKGVEAGDDVRYCALNFGDATVGAAFVEVCEHPGVGLGETCPYCGERNPPRYLDPADAAEPVKTCADYAIYGGATALTSGWWVVKGVATITNRIEIAGSVNLLLCDGAELTAAQGFHVTGTNNLTIWAQSNDRATAGRLTVTTPDGCIAGIGGNDYEAGGRVTVNGGVLTIAGGYKGSAIGGGRCGSGGVITVNGGFVRATGGTWGTGLGGGMAVNASSTSGNAGSITINGGEVTATGGSWSPGIGGAGGTSEGANNGSSGGTVTIHGGTVAATGGNWGAGIGGGRYAGGVTVVVTGGTVTAAGGGGQAIGEGSGWSGVAGSLVIDGMRVFASTDGTVPVASADREDTCRGTLARLEPCPHHYENGACVWCGADSLLAYAAWAGTNGVAGAWNATDASGVHNIFRYAFDNPSGAITNPPLLSISFDASGNPVVLTPPLVNGEGFALSILATDTLGGTNGTAYPLAPSGTNAIPASASPSRFSRLKATEQ